MQTDRRLGWKVWQVLQRESKPSWADYTIWRATTSTANCRLISLWAERFKLSTCCWLPVSICRNRQIEQHFFSRDREQSEIHNLHGMEFQKLASPTMVRSTRQRRSVRSLMLMDSLTEQAVQDTHNQTEFLRELWKQPRVSWRRARTSMKHFSRTGQLPWTTATIQLSYWWGGSFERPFRLYHHRWIHTGHIFKMQGRYRVKISSVKRKRLINATEWSTWDIWKQVNMSGWKTWIVVVQWRRIIMQTQPRSYVGKMQHGDVRRNRRHLKRGCI